MDKSHLLDRLGATGDDRLLLAKVLDRAEQAQRRNIPAATDFLSPQQQMQTLDLLRLAGVPETAYARLGGYDGSERNLFLFLPDCVVSLSPSTSTKAPKLAIPTTLLPFIVLIVYTPAFFAAILVCTKLPSELTVHAVEQPNPTIPSVPVIFSDTFDAIAVLL